MIELARYERYLDRMGLTLDAMREAGFGKTPPDFMALVAEDVEHGDLVGMAVTYLIPYTYTGRPVLVVKELFIAEQARSLGIGAGLMAEVARLALELNCMAVRWQVAPWNERGRRFYERLGAVEDNEWVNYALEGEALLKLASRVEPNPASS
ncbi:MAG TPA: GNAT family N-acetyltransferase [Rhodothermales bacterium]